MKLEHTKDEEVVLTCTRDEIILFNNALNEICNGPNAIEAWEFHPRTGAEKKEAQALLSELSVLIDSLSAKPSRRRIQHKD